MTSRTPPPFRGPDKLLPALVHARRTAPDTGQHNVVVRQAAMVALGFNLLMVATAIIAIMKTVPNGHRHGHAKPSLEAS